VHVGDAFMSKSACVRHRQVRVSAIEQTVMRDMVVVMERGSKRVHLVVVLDRELLRKTWVIGLIRVEGREGGW
jgi:hypothetical protein